MHRGETSHPLRVDEDLGVFAALGAEVQPFVPRVQGGRTGDGRARSLSNQTHNTH